MDLELVEPVALEDRPANPGHAGTQLVYREVAALRGQPGDEIENERENGGSGTIVHGQAPVDDTGKPLKFLGSERLSLDTCRGRALRSVLVFLDT